MLEQMPANRRMEKNQCNIKNANTELKSAIGINSGIKIWDRNQMLRSHNNLHLKSHTRSNMSVQRRNWQQTWILDRLCPPFYTPLPDSDICDALTHQSQNRGSEPWKRAQTSIIGRVGGCKIHRVWALHKHPPP